jgi:leucyl/phenylalanyl-tRNA---protein transferase
MLHLHKLDSSLWFPNPEHSTTEPNGLLAFGGDLSVDRLKCAYHSGIFPWFSEGEPILWWSPDPRGIVELDSFCASKSLRKYVRNTSLTVSLNTAFTEVIEACAKIPRGRSGTWITDRMIAAYIDLHNAGHAHSIEVWDGKMLVGGLYGVASGGVFCGESMFHRVSNASKLAFYYLVEHLRMIKFDFIDCQMQNSHLASLGCVEIPRSIFLSRLANCANKPITKVCWDPKILKFNK